MEKLPGVRMRASQTDPFTLLVLIAGLGVLSVSSCDDLPTGPTTATAGPLTVQLTVAPVSIPTGRETTATIRIRNSLDRDTTLTATMGCLAFLTTRRGGDLLTLKGTGFPCTAAGAGFTVPASGTFEETHQIEAVLPNETMDPAPPGDYVLTADFNVSEIPTLQRRFEVQIQ